MTVTVSAPAKINLYLDVVGKQPNGYHDVVTVMQSLSLADTLTVTKAAGSDITLDTGGVLPADDSNLIMRAARRYFAASGAPFGVHIVLEKRIPMAAGMGGGSADAAATLKALNALDGARFSLLELAEIGASIGADVPFCVRGGTCLCEGIGEVMTPVPSRLSAAVVVAIDGEGVSTPQAFAALDSCYANFVGFASDRTPAALLDAMEKGDISATVKALFNRFEEVIEPQRPAVRRLKDALLSHGAAAAQMSGSGPSVFGLFTNADAAQKAVDHLTSQGIRAYLCEMRCEP